MGFPSYGATWLDPGLKWKTLETPHFSIHYYTELEDTALKLAPIAEEVHAALSKVFKYEPDMKTEVVLLDRADHPIGSANVFPYPAVFVGPTYLGSNLEPFKYNDYLRALFTHEYAHVLHLDMAEGMNLFLRRIFGRVVFPNAVSPQFIIEGLATYIETYQAGEDWGRSPRWEMLMRMDVLEDNLKTIDQAAMNTVKWPMRRTYYLYGVKFLEYLTETYGEENLILLLHRWGDPPFRLSPGIDQAFTSVYGKNLGVLWGEWLKHLLEKYRDQRRTLGKLTEEKLLTGSGYYNLKPKWAKDSRSIFYIQQDTGSYPQIRRLEAASGKSEKILEAQVFDDTLSLSPDGNTLLFSKCDTYENFYLYKDLYLLNLKSGKAIRLTDGLRAMDPCFLPDGKKIVFVRNEKGARSLLIRDYENTKYLVSPEADAQYFSPSSSPDGKILAAAKHAPGGSQKIYLVNINSGSEEVLIQNDYSSAEANPCFSPDGKYVLYDSDRSGIVNLYACELATGKIYQITNVLGGALMPDISPDGKRIAYVSYSSRGYDIAVTDFEPSEWEEVRSLVTATKPVLSKRTSGPKAEFTTVHDYNPWPSLLPKFWLPSAYSDENGSQASIYVGGMDSLTQHLYYLNFGYDFGGNKPSYAFYYANNQFLPQITVSLSDASVPYDGYWEREREAILLLSFRDNRVFTEYDKQSWTFGLQAVNLTNINHPRPTGGNLNAFVLGWNYSSVRRYLSSISPEDGMEAGGKVEAHSSLLGSDFTFNNYSASLKAYFKTFLPHCVLTPDLKLFYSRGDQLEPGNFTWRYLFVRGYPGAFLKGNKGASFSLEYRFPLWYVEKGWFYGYAFLDRVWGNVFFDAGGAAFGTLDKLTIKKGAGAEINFDVSGFWWYLPVTLKLGYAKGLDEGGEGRFYFALGVN
ncbi:PD40 domain-containing protein [Candidatus Saganbacteria bacterium]|uniref:PD40 domain-containing protein n=1 Tax=Candidatus Saganbacteria bacterium TaxID=2575572 RepID=A0A9D6UKF9_UNCSA|nr:PD40 domain-containing protein [Candidatus Saganbacteria bacterium]